LGLCPLRDEVGEDLGLYGLSRAELKVEFAQLDRPLDNAPHSVAIVQHFSEREAGDDLDLVRLEVMLQLARRNEESVQHLLRLRVPNLANIVDMSLDGVLVTFFRSLSH
jgi:hypothetical protein